MKTALDILVTARNMIRTPDRWCQRTAHAFSDGTPCGPQEPLRRRRCASRALFQAAQGITDSIDFRLAWDTLAFYFPPGVRSVMDLNDTHPYDVVISVFNKAIIKLGGAP